MSWDVTHVTPHVHDSPRRRVDVPPEHGDIERGTPAAAGPEVLGPALRAADTAVRAERSGQLQARAGNRAVQRLAEASAPDVEHLDVAARIDEASGGGRAIDRQVRRKLERGIGASLEHVRVHDDAEADSLAKAVGSMAFTTGSDIFFRQGAYQPRSREGLRVLAHEVSHTVQQAAGDVDGTPVGGISLSHPGDRFEQAAEHTADRVMSGHEAPTQMASSGKPAPKKTASVQRYDVGNVSRGLWDTAEAIPGMGNMLSLATGVGHGLSTGISHLQGDRDAAQKSADKSIDNLLNAIPIYGNIRAGHQAYQNFTGGNPEKAMGGPEGGAQKHRDSVANVGKVLWDVL